MAFSLSTTASLGLAAVGILLVVGWKYASSRGGHLPPGPSPLPLVGNLLDIPKKSPWLTYRDLSRQYGM